MTSSAVGAMALVLGMMLATVLSLGVGERINRPFPVLVLLIGAALALIPGVPRVRIDPNLILPLFLPPLIYAASQRISWRLLWDRRRSVITLAGVLVLVTVAAVSATAREIVPGITGAAAVAFGALAAPPDPVAAESVAAPLGLPRRLVTTLQAEGLCNDATALVVYGLAVQFISGERYPAWEAVPKFAYEAAAGVGVGLAVAVLSRWLLGQLTETTARSGLTLIVPFACYLLAAGIGSSGVLAVLAAGLFLGRRGDDDAGVEDRLMGGAFWDTIELLITGAAFALIGLELREVIDSHVAIGSTIVPAAVCCAVIIAVRFAWMLVGGPLVRHMSSGDRRSSGRNWREDLVLGWCGMRGLATIALALALPLSTPARGRLLLMTFAIIVATLVLPGLTLPWLVNLLGVHADADAETAATRALATRAAKASLARLRELDTQDDLPAEVSEVLRRRQQGMVLMLAGDAAETDHGHDPDHREKLAERARQVRQLDTVYAEMLAAARQEILRARFEPGTDPAVADDVLRQLDLRSARLILTPHYGRIYEPACKRPLAGLRPDISRSGGFCMISTCLANNDARPRSRGAAWEGTLRARHVLAAGAAIATSVLFAAACGSSSGSTGASAGSSAGSGSSVNWATVSSVAAGGGMNALVAAAKKEGQLNVITLPDNWANYGTIMKDFTAKYGIKITDANPDGSSQDELNAIAQLKGQSRAPDVVDVGTAFAVKGEQAGDWAPYKVATWGDIPDSSKAANGDYYADYGGYVAIGYDPAKVKVAPTSFKSLLNSMYKNQVAINGNPTEAGAAFAAVYAAAIANGGSFANIAPGVAYFKQLHQSGNFVPVTGSATTVENGQTPILIWWDYLLASEVKPSVPNLKIVIPSDAAYAAYYDQAISKYAPDPAAARLWEEYLYSVTGQNLWLEGQARPIELPTLQSDGTANQTALAALPQAPSATLTFPSNAQQSAAETVVAQQWATVGS